MTETYTYSFTEPINPEQLQYLLQQTGWAKNRSPLQLQQMLDRSQLTLCVWHDDKPIGFARVVTDDIYRAWIEDVVVDEAYRKQGIGSKMLDKLLKRLEHIEVVSLNCDHELIPFYGRHGFKSETNACMSIYQPKAL